MKYNITGNITGTTRKRNGKWYWRIRFCDVGGNRREITGCGGKNKTETLSILSEKLKEIEHGSSLDNISIAAIYSLYIRDIEKKGRKTTTINFYKGLYNKYISILGHRFVRDLKTYELKIWLDDLECSDTTKQHVYDFLKCLFKFAYRLAFIDSYVVIDRLERPARARSNVNNMSFDDYFRIVNFLYSKKKDDYKFWLLYCFVVLASELGTRRGELCGLSWDNVNLSEKYVNICKALIYDNGKTYLSSLKSSSSTRKLYLTDEAVSLLNYMRIVCNKNKLMCGAGYIDNPYGDDLIFRWQDGQAVHPDWFTRKFKDLQVMLGYSKFFRLHDLRHFNAAVLIKAGLDVKSVQSRLGHADASTTLNIYAYSFSDKQENVTSALSSLIGGKSGGKSDVN